MSLKIIKKFKFSVMPLPIVVIGYNGKVYVTAGSLKRMLGYYQKREVKAYIDKIGTRKFNGLEYNSSGFNVTNRSEFYTTQKALKILNHFKDYAVSRGLGELISMLESPISNTFIPSESPVTNSITVTASEYKPEFDVDSFYETVTTEQLIRLRDMAIEALRMRDDNCIVSDVSIETASAMLGIKELKRLLIDTKILIGSYYMPAEQYVSWFTVSEELIDGELFSNIKITPLGYKSIARKFNYLLK